jgi:hypothetical protein
MYSRSQLKDDATAKAVAVIPEPLTRKTRTKGTEVYTTSGTLTQVSEWGLRLIGHPFNFLLVMLFH